MKWIIGEIEKDCFIRVTLEGEFSTDNFTRIFDDLLSREYWKPGTHILFDNLNLTLQDTNIDLVRQASDCYVAHHNHIDDGRIALLMNTLADFGRGRQFGLITENNSEANIHIFMKEAEAVNWLIS